MATTPVAPRPLVPAPKPATPVSAVPPKPVAPAPVKPAAPMFKSPYANKMVKEIVTKHVASMFLVDVQFTDGTHYFIKTSQGVLELGGTADWDTGTKS